MHEVFTSILQAAEGYEVVVRKEFIRDNITESPQMQRHSDCQKEVHHVYGQLS